VLELVRQWLAAGVMEEGRVTETLSGTPQGCVISPLLSNIYLHELVSFRALPATVSPPKRAHPVTGSCWPSGQAIAPRVGVAPPHRRECFLLHMP